MSTIIFSIIIPHKNIPELLQRCLNTIPSRDDVQVIVVDDNSDGNIVDFNNFPQWQGINYKVLFTKEGKGSGFARNIGLKYAKGEWVLFADADDYYYTKNLSSLMDMEIPDEYEVLVWVSKYVYLDGSVRWLKESNNNNNDNRLIKYNTTEKIYTDYCTPWAKMVKKDTLIKSSIKFEEVKYSNDLMFSIYLGLSVNHYAYINSTIYHHERIEGSLMEKRSLQNSRCRISVILRGLKVLNNRNGFDRYHDALISLFTDIYSYSYLSYLSAFYEEFRILGYKRTKEDYKNCCDKLVISRIFFLKKLCFKRLKQHIKAIFHKTFSKQNNEDIINNDKNKGAKIGKNVTIIPPISPVIFSSEPYLISIGDNTTISFDVVFITHDAATRVIRNLPDGNPETVIYGTIQIGNNCFIGARTTILPNVQIGDNTIIGACSLVNKDIPSNVVAAGNPCRVICTLDEYREKHKDEFLFMVSLPYEKKKAYLLNHFDIE